MPMAEEPVEEPWQWVTTGPGQMLAKGIAADFRAAACCSCSYRRAKSLSSARGGPGIRMPKSDTLRFAITLMENPKHPMHTR